MSSSTAAARAAKPTTSSGNSSIQESAKATILVVEDYTDTREMLSVLLRNRGYKVIEAEDGVEGLLKAGWVYPDLIIMDLSLPEMDGVEVARRIHAQAKLSKTPIFVLSAYLTEAVKADVRAAGCMETFSKPFDAEALLAKITATLDSSRTG
jgi:DNA-binding response OmpR family regulator